MGGRGALHCCTTQVFTNFKILCTMLHYPHDIFAKEAIMAKHVAHMAIVIFNEYFKRHGTTLSYCSDGEKDFRCQSPQNNYTHMILRSAPIPFLLCTPPPPCLVLEFAQCPWHPQGYTKE